MSAHNITVAQIEDALSILKTLAEQHPPSALTYRRLQAARLALVEIHAAAQRRDRVAAAAARLDDGDF